jgi:hypothetical protein
MAFGHHLGPDKDINGLILEAFKQFNNGPLPCGGIPIHAGDAGIREKFVDRGLNFFGAEPQFLYFRRSANVAAGGCRAGKPAVMAFKGIGLLVIGKGDITMFAALWLPA